ncbi:MAG: hypothetical protein NVSMB64_17850 [Candidatus Velthaea sp.]
MSATAVAYLCDVILQTVGIASGSLAIALALGIPLALLIVRPGRSGRFVAGAASAVRAVPDLVLAIVFVVAVGLGPAAGVLALGLHYSSVVAKLYAEILAAVRRDAAEALRATGATSSAAFMIGMLPAAWPGLVGFGAYVFESIVRASVIVGVVGAGGIGSLMVQQLNLADYAGFTTTIVTLVVLVFLADVGSERLRRHAPPAVVVSTYAGILVLGFVAFAVTSDPPWMAISHAPAHLAAFGASAFPPDFSRTVLSTAAIGVVQCVGVALLGTVAGAALALPFAWFAAAAARAATTFHHQGAAERTIALFSRAVLGIVRAVPCLALGLIGLSIVGLGLNAGIFALTLHTAGVLGKLLAESIETAERGPSEALAAIGATRSAATAIGLLPGAAGAMAAHVLYRFEWNVRASTILGMVGAGGLGQAIFNAQQLLFYRQLIVYVFVAVLLVLTIDAAAGRVRERWHLRTLSA